MSDASQAARVLISRHRVGSVTHLRIGGIIDETFSPQSISNDLVGHVIVDLGRLERISSFGVRKWIEFAGKLPPGAMAVYVIHAPPIVVDQLNMVEGFAGIARVLSMLAPYRCDTCNEDRMRLVDLEVDRDALAAGQAPAHTCPVCSTRLEFADIPSEFFDFARHQNVSGPVDPVVHRYIRALTPSSVPEDASVSKIIDGDVTFFRMGGAIRADINVRRMAAGVEGRVAYDFGTVKSVDPAAVPRLHQIIATAAATAKIFLCRVPAPVLAALAQGKTLPPATLTTLQISTECSHCGTRYNRKIEAAVYLDLLASDASLETQCDICGGAAALVPHRELVGLLSSMQLGQAPAEVEALEQRALSQYLSTVAPDMTPTRNGSGESSSSSGRLQVLRRLGRGGMAEVFLARQQGVKGFEKYVVVKKILGQFAQSADFVEMLFAEARANARLTHPNIVQTFDVGMTDGVAYITMEYVRGPDCKKAMMELRKKGISIPLEHALRIVAETAAGLHYAHSYVDPTGKPHPMVHRDVSPHNILLSLDGAIKLSDFGIAKVQGESEHTQAGVLKGKIAYVSPEAVSGMPLDARNDVFALGVVLFELLTGRLPFKRENDAATLRAIVREPAPNPTELNPAVPQDISNIILWSLEKDPSRRVQTAAQLREAIEQTMARHGMSSSASAVAEYFKQHLANELAEYGPVQAPAPASSSVPPDFSSKPNTDSLSLIELDALGSSPSAVSLATDPFSPTHEPSGRPGPPVPDDHSGARLPPLLGEEPSTSPVAPPAPLQPPAPARPSAPARAAPSVAPPQPHPVPAAARSNGSGRSASAAVGAPSAAPSSPRTAPARTSVSGNLALASAAHASPAPVKPLPPEPVSHSPETRGHRSQPWALVAGVAVALAAAGVAAALIGSGGGDVVAVSNLGTGESLYVNGVRVDPSNVRATGSSLYIAVGREGRLLRFGTADSKDGIDARALVDAPDIQPGRSQATMLVHSEPRGCFVQVGNQRLSELTPTQISVDAGKELELTIQCSNQPPWTRKVMAIPGQHIEVSAALASK